MKDPKIFVALDYNSSINIQKAVEDIQTFSDVGVKINLDYILEHGYTVIKKLKHIAPSVPLFVDLKMWNGTRTMEVVIQQLEQLGVDYTNIYALAGTDVLELINHDFNIKILGLTILSHYDSAYCRRCFGQPLSSMVVRLAKIAAESNCYGIILPPTQLEVVRGLQIKKVCPGIRPDWYQDKRHKQVTTPKDAVQSGADMLVIGSPITKSKNRIDALQKIMEELK